MTIPNVGRILVADDEEIFLASTADLLRREGYECVTASDGYIALQRFRERPFDVVISDVEMPGNTDLAFVRQAIQLDPNVPVILITGIPSTRSAVVSVELAVARYLLKPVSLPDLLDGVRSAMERVRNARAVVAAEHRLRRWAERHATALASRRSRPPGTTDELLLDDAIQTITDSLVLLGNRHRSGARDSDPSCGRRMVSILESTL